MKLNQPKILETSRKKLIRIFLRARTRERDWENLDWEKIKRGNTSLYQGRVGGIL
jgi:hypothetical protein